MPKYNNYGGSDGAKTTPRKMQPGTEQRGASKPVKKGGYGSCDRITNPRSGGGPSSY